MTSSNSDTKIVPVPESDCGCVLRVARSMASLRSRYHRRQPATTMDEAIPKRAMKPRTQPSQRSNNRPPSASAQPAPSQDEIKTEAARRIEIDEEAFSKAEDLGADCGWPGTQEILDGDGRI